MHDSPQARLLLKRVIESTASAGTGFSFANNHTQSIDIFSSTTPSTATSTSTLPFVVASPPLSVTSSLSSKAPTSQPTLVPTATSATKTSDNDSSSLSGGAIAGIVIGVLACVIIICLLLFIAHRRRRRRQQEQQSHSNNPPMSNNFHAVSTTNNPPTPATAAAGVALFEPSRQTPDDPWLGQVPLGTYTVVSTYNPSLEDEIYVLPGDVVQVYAEYDDGWCLGMNISRDNARGVFPKSCFTVDEVNTLDDAEASAQADKRRSRRTSSLFNSVQKT
ncbi:hypothetical protein K492DRAFT_203133 [Lichtheimia hyalospora FSU 10163]|nr:hypothetical protein K492DRAFT_203133 [Lichtheimia hyalospora FSU 10163]